MVATAHLLVAGAIASRVQNPALAVSLSFVSHFIMDAVPHWDIGTDWRKRTKLTTGATAILDTLIGAILSFAFFRSSAPSVPLLLACMAASVLPDWLETPWYIFFADPRRTKPKKNAGVGERIAYRMYKLSNAFHRKTSFIFGTATQIATVLFFLLLLS